jgi:hypothetical protein
MIISKLLIMNHRLFAAAAVGGTMSDLEGKIAAQGEKVRMLKAAKASKVHPFSCLLSYFGCMLSTVCSLLFAVCSLLSAVCGTRGECTDAQGRQGQQGPCVFYLLSAV